MSKLVDKAKQVATTAGAAATAFSLLVDWDGELLRGKGKPREASLRIAKLPVIRIHADGSRYLFGKIRLRDLKP